MEYHELFLGNTPIRFQYFYSYYNNKYYSKRLYILSIHCLNLHLQIVRLYVSKLLHIQMLYRFQVTFLCCIVSCDDLHVLFCFFRWDLVLYFCEENQIDLCTDQLWHYQFVELLSRFMEFI